MKLNWLPFLQALQQLGGRPGKEKDTGVLQRSIDFLRTSGAPAPGETIRKWCMEIADFHARAGRIVLADFEEGKDAPPVDSARVVSRPKPKELHDGDNFAVQYDGASMWDIHQMGDLFARIVCDEAGAAAVLRALTDAAKRGWNLKPKATDENS